MATIARIQRANSVTYRAVIKLNGSVLKTKCFKTKTAARQWARRVECDAQMMEALGERGARITLAEVARDYLDAWNGRARSRIYQVRWWVTHLGHKSLAAIGPDDIRDCLRRYRGTSGQQATTLSEDQRSPASVNRMKAALSAIFTFAARRGDTVRNPARQVATEPEHNKRMRYLTEDERIRLLVTCRESRWPKLYLLVLSALMTGARKGELRSLRWERIDFAGRQVALDRTKNGEPRVLSLPTPVIEELMRFRQTEGLVFASERRPRSHYDEKKVWALALQQAAIEDFRFHDLRHSAASYLAMGGATLLEIADVLGHKSLQTTKRYAHLSLDHKRELTDRLLGSLQI